LDARDGAERGSVVEDAFDCGVGKGEVRNQRSEIRDQKSEVRSQKSEIRNQKSEIRDQKSEVRDQSIPLTDVCPPDGSGLRPISDFLPFPPSIESPPRSPDDFEGTEHLR